MTNDNFSLNKAICTFQSATGKSYWTIKQACEGILIMGSNGSGKTSGSGAYFAKKYLENNFGGVVLTVKPEDASDWIQYAKETNRLDDIILLEPNGSHSFNFLEYLSKNLSDGISLTDNIVQVIKTVLSASEEKSSAKNDDPFWESALDLLLFNVIDLCQLAYGQVSVDHMYDILSTAPKPGQKQETDLKIKTFAWAFNEARVKIGALISTFVLSLCEAEKEKLEDDHYKDHLYSEHIEGYIKLKDIDQFFSEYFLNISSKTRAIIEILFTGFLFRLRQEPVYSLFCKKTSTVVPEDCLDGKIIIVNIPVKKFDKVGRDSQILFKYIFQKAMEKRNIKINSRPVFLWADESYQFIHPGDTLYQATARSCRLLTVYLCQNLPNFRANMGGSKSEPLVKSFIATMGTKIFHSNSDLETNEWASQLIGSAWEEDLHVSSTVSGTFQSGRSRSYKLERMVRPEEFIGMRSGGAENDYCVQGIIHMQNKRFSDGLSHKKINFRQSQNPNL